VLLIVAFRTAPPTIASAGLIPQTKRRSATCRGLAARANLTLRAASRPRQDTSATAVHEPQSALNGGPSRVISYFSKMAAIAARSECSLREIGPNSS
jgi:hypothetical protein